MGSFTDYMNSRQKSRDQGGITAYFHKTGRKIPTAELTPEMELYASVNIPLIEMTALLDQYDQENYNEAFKMALLGEADAKMINQSIAGYRQQIQEQYAKTTDPNQRAQLEKADAQWGDILNRVTEQQGKSSVKLQQYENFAKFRQSDYWHLDEKIAQIAAQQYQGSDNSNSWFKGSNLFSDGYQPFDVMKTIGATAIDAGQEVVEGAGRFAEHLIDAAVTAGGLVYGAFGNDAARIGAETYVANSLNWEKISRGVIPGQADGDSVLGGKSDALANSLGEMGAKKAVEYFVPGSGLILTGISAFGAESENALRQGATISEAALSGLISAGAETFSEKLFGGSGLEGKGIINTEAFTKNLTTGLLKTMLDYGIDIFGEGAEEVISQFISNLGSKLYREENLEEILFSKEAWQGYLDSFVSGAVMGGLLNGGKAFGTLPTKTKGWTDYRTGLTADQQKLFNQEYKARIAQATSNGTRLNSKARSAIYDATLANVKSGKPLAFSPTTTPVGTAIPDGPNPTAAPSVVNAAIATVREGGTVTNAMATAIVDNPAAVSYLTEQTGMELPDTMSGKRNAVKQAVSKLAEGLTNTAQAAVNGAQTAAVSEGDSGAVGAQEGSEGASGGTGAQAVRFAKGNNGKLVLQTSDGSAVDVDQAEFGSEDEAVVYHTVAKLATNAPAANLMLSTYEGSDVPAMTFAKGVEEAFVYGSAGIPLEQAMERGSFISELKDYQVRTAYKLGQMYGSKNATTEQGEASKKEDSGSRAKAVRKKGTVKGYGVKMKDLSKAFNTAQRQAYNILCQIAEVTGIDIVLFESKADAQGNLRGGIVEGIDMNDAQGAFSWKNNKIYIDINAGVLKAADLGDVAKYSMLRTFSHEFTHFLEKHDAQQYNVFRDIVFDVMRRNGVDPDALIEDYIKRHKGTTRDAASREVVAEAMTDILPESSFIQELAQKHKNIFKKLLDRLKEFVAEIKAHFKSIGSNQSKEAAAVKDYMGDAIRYTEELVEAFDRLAVSAVENYQTAIFDGGTPNGAEQGKQKETDKGGTDTGVSDAQSGTRTETGGRPGISENVGQTDGAGQENPVTERQRRGLNAEGELYSEEDHYTPAEGSPLYIAQNEIQSGYKVRCRVIKDSAWKHDRPARCRNQVIYVSQNINADTLATLVPHETTHIMKHFGFAPYIEHILETADLLDMQNPNAFKLLETAANHVGVDIFDLDDIQQLRVYDELNSIVYGFCKGGILSNPNYSYGEWIPDAFYDFEGFINKLDALHDQFKQSQKAKHGNNHFSEELNSTETEQFMKWFGDWKNDPENASKAVDADGKPLVMYHGTSSYGFSVFDTYGGKFGLFGKGSYFTDDPSVAESYTQKGNGNKKGVYAVYLNIRNPMDMDAKADLNAWRKAFKDAGLDQTYLDEADTNEDAFRALKENLQDYGYVRWEAEELVTDLIEGMGYDGITHIGGGRYNQKDGTRHRVFVAFESEQIKSATDNTGAYDSSDPDIYHQERTETLTNRDIIGEIEGKNDLEQKALKEYREILKHARKLSREYTELTQQLSQMKSAEGPKDPKTLNALKDKIIKTKNRRDTREDQLRRMEDGLLAPVIRREKGTVLEKLRNVYGTIPKGEKAVRDDSLPVSVDQETKVSQTARTVKGAGGTPEDFAELIDTEVVKGGLSYLPISNDEATQKAVEWIKKEGWEAAKIKWSADVRSGKVSAELSARGALLLNNAANAGDKTTWLEILHDYQYMGTNAGQATQALQILKKLQPEDKLYMIRRSIQYMVEDMHLGVEITIDPEIEELYRNAETYEEEDWYLSEIQQSIADQLPVTWMEKWTALRYVNMLGNLRTQLRNLSGNVGMLVVTSAKDAIAAGLEQIAYKASSGRFRKTKALTVNSEMLKAARVDYAIVESVIQGGGKYSDSVSETSEFARAIRDRQKIFKSKLLQGYRKGTNWAMDTGDAFFSKIAYARALAGYLKANGVEDSDFSKVDSALLNEARLYAVQEAQEATFRDTNLLSGWLSKIGRRSDTPKFAKAIAEGVVPFRKTPANVLVRAEEYSPLGIVNSLVLSIRARGANSDITGAQVINSWAKSLTGTGLYVLGMLLQSMGCLVGGPDDDESLDKFEDLNGQQNYALKFGDLYITIDWLSPAAMPLFMGSQIGKIGQECDVELKDVIDVLISLGDPMIQMSMLQGVNDTLENVRYAKNSIGQLLINAASSYLTQGLTNSLFGQIERGFEAQRMSTYIDKNSGMPDWMQKNIGKASAKIPGLDYQQIPYINAWGEEEQNPNVLLNTIYNMLSPSYISVGQEDSVSQELTRLNEIQDDVQVFPSTPKKTLTFTDSDGVKHTDYNLSAEEYVALAKEQGQTQREIVEDMIDSEFYEGLPDKYKAKAIEFAYTYAKYHAQIEVLDRDGFDANWMAEISGNTAEGILTHIYEEYIKQMYQEGYITADEAIRRRMKYHGDSAEKARDKVSGWDQ